MGSAGFEPTKAEPTDLQSAPFDRFGNSPNICQSLHGAGQLSCLDEPVEGFEPPTPRLQITCSGQLSYTGVIKYIFKAKKVLQR